MENKPPPRWSENAPAADTWQKNFNYYVSSYNSDFLFFLQRAASGHYKGLVASGKTLKDLHEMVIFMQKATDLRFEVVPHPFTFRHGSEYYRALGFTDEEIAKIHGFFDHVKAAYDKDFEEIMSEDAELLSSYK